MINSSLCSGCAACAQICPNNSIVMKQDEKGFLSPVKNAQKCNGCGLCDYACEKAHLISKKQRKAYISYSTDEFVRQKSSSGGVFYNLAEYVVEHKGVVFGVVFDENFKAIHKGTDNKEDLSEYLGSKYVQSDVKNTYREVKALIEKGVIVLFSGTPCQVAGLYGFLQGKQYDNLISVSLICHGVPSPEMWKRHISMIQSSYNSKIKDVKFREKNEKYPWGKYHLKIEFETGVYDSWWYEDDFFWGFENDCFNRESCYQCTSKSERQKGDLIIGDYWTAYGDKTFEKINGVSLVITQSKLGEKIIEDSKCHLYVEEIDYESCLAGNKAIDNSVCNQKSYEDFWSFFEKTNDYKGAVSFMRNRIELNHKKIKSINNENKSIVLWGMGNIFNEYARLLLNELNVDYLCDGRNDRVGTKVYDIPVIDTKHVSEIKNVKVIIMLDNLEFIVEILKQLSRNGIKDFDIFRNLTL